MNLIILRSFETKEFICNIESAFQRADERERAEKAVKFAKSALMSTGVIIDSRGSSLSETEARKQLTAAQSKLNAALVSLKSVQRRNGLISEFRKKTKKPQVVKSKLQESY